MSVGDNAGKSFGLQETRQHSNKQFFVGIGLGISCDFLRYACSRSLDVVLEVVASMSALGAELVPEWHCISIFHRQVFANLLGGVMLAFHSDFPWWKLQQLVIFGRSSRECRGMYHVMQACTMQLLGSQNWPE